MPAMTGLILVDTNVALYAIGKDAGKKAIAREIMAGRPIVRAIASSHGAHSQ